MEKVGIPTVFIVTAPFVSGAKYHAQSEGMPGIRIVATPTAQVLGLNAEEVREQAKLIIGDIFTALTAPLVPKREAARTRTEQAKRLAFEGTVEEVNRYFLLHHWTDGLPIMPPTEEAVKWMLTGTDRSPEEAVGIIPPRNGGATVEVIATNAVMAGCRPEYMPVLLAAVEAITEEQFNLSGVQATTNSVSPLLIVNGSIRRDLNINSEMGLLGYGWQANNTIGRALRLIMIAVGGSWPGINAMCTLGKLPIWVIGEWEEVSPWEPLHVELGYESDNSTVTTVHASGFHSIAGGVYPGERLLENFGPIIGQPGPLSRGYWWGVDLTLVLNPLHAATFAADGYSKEDIKRILIEKAQVPFSRFKSSHYTPGKVGDACSLLATATDECMIPLVDGTDQLTIVVASGRNWGHAIFFPAWGCCRSRVTKTIELPANWGDLIMKAREELQY